jgi:hypothetical protein
MSDEPNPNSHNHLPCLCDGCPNTRHSRVNPYCYDCRAAYQKAIRVTRGGSYVTDPLSTDKRLGRPWRPIDEKVQYFINKINNRKK